MIRRNREITNYDREISDARRYIGKRVASWAGGSALVGTIAAGSEALIVGKVTGNTAGVGALGAGMTIYIGSLAEYSFGYVEASLSHISRQKDLRYQYRHQQQTEAGRPS